MRSQNRADTLKWKKKRKEHFGDKCSKAKCPICSAHKNIGNSLKHATKKQLIEKDKKNEK